MTEFHKTVGGSKFYNLQIPRLLDNLERIAEALEKIADAEETVEGRLKKTIVEAVERALSGDEDRDA